ncbi:hypothetical protein MIZ03_1850 [Rhodoferax lithotrophicus]|uniref:Uncharacterized protein n=1 Tax=Rhodoferax lithotrophicus TaxID=2798804 RepID=A0ABN6DAD0_9BURK|nr:hypothetical protein MIZ03_1850 [Rhodoferax sp. MIZ03]
MCAMVLSVALRLDERDLEMGSSRCNKKARSERAFLSGKG